MMGTASINAKAKSVIVFAVIFVLMAHRGRQLIDNTDLLCLVTPKAIISLQSALSSTP